MTNPPKKIYGLIGYPVKHSLSAVMHNAAFKALGIQAEYRLFEVEPSKLEGFLLGNIKVVDTQGEEFNSQDIAGFNITIPHKVRAKEILEHNFPDAKLKDILIYVRISGAVNTVLRMPERKMEYLNTDVTGFFRSLKENLGFNHKDKNILLFGCGGAGRAVVGGLIWKNILPNNIYIYEPNSEAKKSAEAHFGQFDITREKVKFISAEEISDMINKCQLLVNATPVGMKNGDGSVINKELLRKDLYVYDVVYNRETQLIRDARAAGCHTVGGGRMLLYQGHAAFCLWFPGRPDKDYQIALEAMRTALEREILK